jgi:hypothetical protein
VGLRAPLSATLLENLVVVLSATGVFAQTELSAPDDISRGSTATCLFSWAPVPNAPFSAEVTIAWQPPAGKGTEQRAVARYYRDREGRVRVEQGVTGSGQAPKRIILALDDSRRAYLIDPATRTASIHSRGLVDMMVRAGCHDDFVLPLSSGGFIGFYQHPVDRESLGERFRSGVQATGTRLTTELPHNAPFGNGRAEQWVSPELKLVVYLRSEEPNMGTFEYQLTRISRAEPRAELFEAPADAELVEAGGKLPRTLYPGPWRNPYTEMARSTQ